MPILAATAATIRVWLDCTPPMVTRYRHPMRSRRDDIFELGQLVAANTRPELQPSPLA